MGYLDLVRQKIDEFRIDNSGEYPEFIIMDVYAMQSLNDELRESGMEVESKQFARDMVFEGISVMIMDEDEGFDLIKVV